MDATYTVCFKGFDEKAASSIERMLADHVATFTSRVNMESATVERKSDLVPKAKKGKANAKS